MSGDVPCDWYYRSRRIAAWAWLYHFGLSFFSAVLLRGSDDARTRVVFTGLAIRDVVFALMWRRRLGPSTLVAAAVLSDIAAARLLRDRISVSQFQADRSLGQFGVAPAWALLLDQQESPTEGLLLIPMAMQLAFCRIWKLRRRDTALYLAREMAWAAGSLWAVEGLRAQLQDAARTEQRIVDARRETAQLAQDKAAEVGVWFKFHERLSVFNSVRVRAEVQGASHLAELRLPYRRIELLASAEHDRFRRDSNRLTLNSVVARILVARLPDDGSTWANPTDDDQVVELDITVEAVRRLLQVVAQTQGTITVHTDVGPSSVEVVVATSADSPAVRVTLPRLLV